MMDEITALLPGLLLHSPTYFLAVSNQEGSCVFANETFKKRFSFSTGNFEGITLQTAVHPDYFDQCTQALTHCLANPEAVESLQMRKTDKAGGGWAHWNFSAFRNGSGNIVGVCCIGHDLDGNENKYSLVFSLYYFLNEK